MPSHKAALLLTWEYVRFPSQNYTSVILRPTVSTLRFVEVLVHQPELIRVPLDQGNDQPAETTSSVNHGEVFTRPWVVDLILDLAGFTTDIDLAALRTIEPACGTGAFLAPMARRLSEACRLCGRSIEEASEAFYAVDLQPENVSLSRAAVVKVLVGEGWPENTVRDLAERWVLEGDFLLGADTTSTADFVLGNPPYVRLEEVRPVLSEAYRRACPTMGGRADLFIGFYETGLRSLKPGGTLGYICADRWMHNQYGKALRALVGSAFSLEAAVIMHDVDAFEEEVSAYPAITILRRKEQGPMVLADTTGRFTQRDATQVVQWAKGKRAVSKRTDAFEIAELPNWYNGTEAWPGGSPEQLRLVAELEARLPRLESRDTGTRVGIGVATGADKVFVTTDAALVEEDRLLPLSMVRDTKTGHFEWSGHHLVDPWDDNGLVDLDQFPILRNYFSTHEGTLRHRNVAGRMPKDWFRTIDRVDHSLTSRAKLLFPDMKISMEPVLEEGGYYPHHNVYYVVSENWPLEILGGLLLSQIANLFMRTYAVKMRGGTLRFQAQYMRRICVPPLDSIRPKEREALAVALDSRDVERATGISRRLYGVSASTLATILGR